MSKTPLTYTFGTVLQHSLLHDTLYLVLRPENSLTEVRAYLAMRLDNSSSGRLEQGRICVIFEETDRDWNVLEVISVPAR